MANITEAVEHLLHLAHKYQCTYLVQIFSILMVSSLTVDNVADRLILVDMYDSDSLKRVCMHFLACHCQDVMLTEGFKRLQSHPRGFTLLGEALSTLAEASGK